MKWFKHDSDASIDSKLQELLLDYGAAGYGLYWYCLELIAQGVSDSNITFELEHDVRIISRNLGLSAQETKDMMQRMIELGLFSMSNNSRLACFSMAKRLDQSMTSNPHMRKIISGFKGNHDSIDESHDPVMINHDSVMLEENRREENRREDIRQEEQKPKAKAKKAFTPPTFEEVEVYAVERNRSDLTKKFFDYYQAGDWCDRDGKKIVGWKQKFITWENNNPIVQQPMQHRNAGGYQPYQKTAASGTGIDIINGVTIRGLKAGVMV